MRFGVRASLCLATLSAVAHNTGRTISTSLGVQRLTIANAPEIAALISRAFPKTSPHSWARALNLDSDMTSYMTGYLSKEEIITNSLGIRQCATVPGGAGNDAGTMGAFIGACILETYSLLPQRDDKTADEGAASSSSGSSSGSRSSDSDSSEDDYKPYEAIEGILEACKAILHQGFDTRKVAPTLETLETSEGNGTYGYIAWLATDSTARNQGIASRLVKESTSIMQTQWNCRYSVAYTVSPAARRVFSACGYERWGDVVYRDWEFKGRRPFAALPDEVSVMVKEL